ncbi:MAG: hypothetical protein CHACPFDD_01846 [Phycisphaerae bacterium]|nr:hypothetical protein [Phycisphaerae bacterium]
MSSALFRRAAMAVPAWLILLASLVLWWDSVANERLALRSVVLAVCATSFGLVLLAIGRRRK